MQKHFPKWVRQLGLPTPIILSVGLPAIILLLVLIVLLIVEIYAYVIAFADHTGVSAAIAALIASFTAVFAVAVAVIAGYYAKGQLEAASEQLKATKGQLEATKGQLEVANEQLEVGQKAARGDFLLRLDEAFRYHQEVHVKLRFGGAYPEVVGALEFPKDWPAIESYMGLFERIQVLVEEKIIDIDVVDRLYGYRLFNIVNNPIIHQVKLVELGDGWIDFIKLWKALADLESNTDKKQPDIKVLNHLNKASKQKREIIATEGA